MNGIGLLVLIAAAGQVAAAQPVGPNRDFGWERDTQNPDRALCYIIQLSPAKVADMQGKAMENPSDMPPELVGRATRILVRIGTDILPQSPSLEELRNMPRVNSPTDVTAQLGGGRLSDVEPSDLLNVQQRGGSPALPGFPGQSSAAPPAGTPQASNQATTPRPNFSDSTSPDPTNPIDQAKQLDRGAPAFPNAAGNPSSNSPGNISPTLPNYADSGSGQSDRAGTVPRNNAPPLGNAGDWRTPIPTDNQPSRDDVNRTADNRGQNQSVGNASGNYPHSGYPQSAYPTGTMPPNYDPRTPPSLDPSTMTSSPNGPPPNLGFGVNPNGQNPGKFGLPTPGFDNFSGQGGQGNQFGPNAPYNQGPYNQGYGGGQYVNGQYGSDQPVGGNAQRPGGYDGFDRVATNTTLPPPNPNPNTAGGGATPAQQPPARAPAVETSPGDIAATTPTGSNSSKTSENILSVFFLFSLVVNFYLGMLIRKLLTRYRALLANMRGQTSPNAFSS